MHGLEYCTHIVYAEYDIFYVNVTTKLSPQVNTYSSFRAELWAPGPRTKALSAL